MARITVEDCLENVANRFELVMVGAKRARQLAAGADTELEWEKDKPTVMAFREIAQNLVNASILDEVTAREHAEESIVSEEELQEVSSEQTPTAE